MAISFPLALPNTTSFREIRWSPHSVVSVTESPFTLNQEVQEFSGQRWAVDVSLIPMKREDAEAWIAWRLKLNGRRGTFLLGDPSAATPRGIGTGTPLVKGASQTGNELITDGWTISQTGILKAGDFLQIGNDLYKNLDDVNSDGSGNATLTIWPSIITAYSDNAAITVSSPKGLFRMTDNVMPWDVDVAQFFGLSFSAVGAI